MEEAQHAKLDTLVVEALAEGRSDAEIAHGVDEYLAIGAFIDGGLKQQVEFDLEAFQRATGRRLGARELERLRVVQHQANRWTYLGSGMTHPEFLATVEGLGYAQRARLEEVAPAFCWQGPRSLPPLLTVRREAPAPAAGSPARLGDRRNEPLSRRRLGTAVLPKRLLGFPACAEVQAKEAFVRHRQH